MKKRLSRLVMLASGPMFNVVDWTALTIMFFLPDLPWWGEVLKLATFIIIVVNSHKLGRRYGWPRSAAEERAKAMEFLLTYARRLERAAEWRWPSEPIRDPVRRRALLAASAALYEAITALGEAKHIDFKPDPEDALAANDQ